MQQSPRKYALICVLLTLMLLDVWLRVHSFLNSPDADLQGETTPIDIANTEGTQSANNSSNNTLVPSAKLETGLPKFPPDSIPPFPADVLARFREKGQFPSDMNQVKHIFAVMESNKVTHLEPTWESFRKHVTHDALNNRIKGEATLRGTHPHHFMHLPAWEKDWGGVAVFSNVFIMGEPPVVFDGNIAFEPRSVCIGDKTNQEARIIDNAAAMAANGSTILQSEQQYDVLISQCYGQAYWHSIVENLPRLVYVRDFIAENKNLTAIWPRQDFLAQDHRPQAFWNPSFFQDTNNPKWHEHSRFEVVFARRLVVPAGSYAQNSQVAEVRNLLVNLVDSHPQMKQLRQQAQPSKKVILFHHRKPGGTRSLLNSHELREALKYSFSHCCVVKDFAHNGTADEAAVLHNQADIVVGPHGAGMANLVFSDPKKLIGVVEIHPNIYDDRFKVMNCNRQLAEKLGIPFKMLITKDGWRESPLTANVPEVIAAVHEMLQV
ncbi:unknown protein [Seminavis robusta]|uniref:Glycosyltransferase 61 catalytic domain-containing protein n=1 Tax=Seminavis robusta TaxID=568900 RepID=A0A9N8HT73_9STRA|nr:unknown protein [Seminavis robusta]|eukprot:Sro1832_g300460.1 n/a (492) ;mRNA; r:16933-18487